MSIPTCGVFDGEAADGVGGAVGRTEGECTSPTPRLLAGTPLPPGAPAAASIAAFSSSRAFRTSSFTSPFHCWRSKMASRLAHSKPRCFTLKYL